MHLGTTGHQRETAPCQKLHFPLTRIVLSSKIYACCVTPTGEEKNRNCGRVLLPIARARVHRNLLFSTHPESTPVRWDDQVHEQRDKTDDEDPTIKPQTRLLAQKCVSWRDCCAATRQWTELSTEHFSIDGISVLLPVRV